MSDAKAAPWIVPGAWTPAWMSARGPRRYLLSRAPGGAGGAWIDPRPWGDAARPSPPIVPADAALAASKGPVLVLATRTAVLPLDRLGAPPPGMLPEERVVVRLPASPSEVLAARRGA